jgi:hypothetical protein
MFSTQDKKLSRGAIPFFPNHVVRGHENEMLLLLMSLSGYSGSSTVAENFDSKDVWGAAAKSHEQAVR